MWLMTCDPLHMTYETWHDMDRRYYKFCILRIYFKEWEMKLAIFCQIHWLFLIFESYQNVLIIMALQPWVMVAKDIFPSATMTDGCKKVILCIFSIKFTFLWKLPVSGVQNSIFMGKSHEISVFATVSHGCKGENILWNHYSWLQRIFSLCNRDWWLWRGKFYWIFHYIYENELTFENMYLPMNLAKKEPFSFLNLQRRFPES